MKINASELDGIGELFGWRIVDDIVEIYTEDDDYWHFAMKFNVYWLQEFEDMAQAMRGKDDT